MEKKSIEAVALPVEIEFSDLEAMEESFAAAAPAGNQQGSSLSQ
jgi:hypothetical protein